MEISLPSALAEFVAAKVKSGQYESEAEVVREALRQSQRLSSLTSSGISGDYANLGALGDADIMAIAFIVMMEATKSAQEDLKAIMDGVKAINAAKSQLRQLLSAVNRDVAANAGKHRPPLKFSAGLGSEQAYHKAQVPFPDPTSDSGVRLVPTDLSPGAITSVDQLQAVQQQLQNQLDSMSEMSEMTSLRLQMAMDRRSKMLETLSNIMKRISKTSETITQNLK